MNMEGFNAVIVTILVAVAGSAIAVMTLVVGAIRLAAN